MAKDKAHTMDFKGLAIEADEFNGKMTSAAIVALTPVSTADGSDPATTQALANALKAKLNAVIAALQS